MDWVKAIAEFHDAGQIQEELFPNLPSEARRATRRRLLEEEYQEYLMAEGSDDLVKIADGLADMIYVAIGTMRAYGIDAKAVVDEVCRSNATKVVEGRLIKRGDGKVLKPPGYEPPRIREILNDDRARYDEGPL